eukprot:3021206-Rhodomonas_salina.2
MGHKVGWIDLMLPLQRTTKDRGRGPSGRGERVSEQTRGGSEERAHGIACTMQRGTWIAYAAMQCAVAVWRMLPCDLSSGIAYDAMRCAVAVWRMVLCAARCSRQC